MFIYGGRSESNAVLNDVWLYSLHLDLWTQISLSPQLPSPSPRFHASCVLDPTDDKRERVLVFGGTDGADCFGDLWSFQAEPSKSEKLLHYHEVRKSDIVQFYLINCG
jgi:hypothetical protein